MATATLPPFPQQLPRTQPDWDRLVNVMQQWQTPLNAAINSSASFTAPTLLNGWSNYGNGYSPAGFYADQQGRVWLRGLITGGTQTSGTVIFVLPTGFTPVSRELLVGSVGNATTFAAPVRVDVLPNGQVLILGIDAVSSPYVGLSGLSFSLSP